MVVTGFFALEAGLPDGTFFPAIVFLDAAVAFDAGLFGSGLLSVATVPGWGVRTAEVGFEFCGSTVTFGISESASAAFSLILPAGEADSILFFDSLAVFVGLSVGFVALMGILAL